MSQDDKNIEYLLELDGEIYAGVEPRRGLWAKVEIQKVAVTSMRPHGIKYSLTLHARNGDRIMGIDNAHTVKYKEKSQQKPRIMCDHWHKVGKSKPEPYEYTNAENLFSDFWAEVDKVVEESE